MTLFSCLQQTDISQLTVSHTDMNGYQRRQYLQSLIEMFIWSILIKLVSILCYEPLFIIIFRTQVFILIRLLYIRLILNILYKHILLFWRNFFLDTSKLLELFIWNKEICTKKVHFYNVVKMRNFIVSHENNSLMHCKNVQPCKTRKKGVGITVYDEEMISESAKDLWL